MSTLSGKSKIPSTSGYRKLAMLAGTCLSASVASSTAATVIETVDFTDDLPTAVSNPLPFDTTTVQGSLNFSTDPNDTFAFVSLLGGSSFTMEFDSLANYFNFTIFDSIGGVIPTAPTTPASISPGPPTQFTGTVPANGIIVAAVSYSEGFNYSVSLDAQTVPEPGSVALLGAGAALLASHRRRSRKDGDNL